MPDDLPTARRFWEHLRKSQVTAGLPLSVHSASLPARACRVQFVRHRSGPHATLMVEGAECSAM